MKKKIENILNFLKTIESQKKTLLNLQQFKKLIFNDNVLGANTEREIEGCKSVIFNLEKDVENQIKNLLKIDYKLHAGKLLKIFYKFDNNENLLTDDKVAYEMEKYLKTKL